MTPTSITSIIAIGLVLLGHFISDFLCQPRFFAENKSSRWGILLTHVLITGTVLTMFIYVAAKGLTMSEVLLVWAVNTSSHFIIDAITSRMTSSLYKAGDIWEMFLVIGFDQFLHTTIAISSLVYVTQCAQ